MKKLYIVTWILIEWIAGGPDPSTDQYGRTSMSVPAICIWRKHEIQHRMEFTTLDSAKSFIANAPKADTSKQFFEWMNGGYCEAMHIDSTVVPFSGTDDAKAN